MKIEHIAIWTHQLEALKGFYIKHFNGQAGSIYHNEKKGFKSYFLSFGSGARMEIMSAPGIPENLNDTAQAQHQGLIHMAFEVASMKEVDMKAKELSSAGFPILDGPRVTGDGYYEFVTLDPDLNRLEVTCEAGQK